MPKAVSTTFSHVHVGDWQTSNNPHSLKRNQACHQCRKRKLKCDAKRPCSTCIRSHAYALAHAPPGAQMPSIPECTYDVVPNLSGIQQQDPPEGRLEKLENKIAELETLLAESRTPTGPSQFTNLPVPGPSQIPIDPALLSSLGPSHAAPPQYRYPNTAHDSLIDPLLTGYGIPQSTGALNSLAEAAALSIASHEMQFDKGIDNSALQPLQPDLSGDVLEIGWPKTLPNPDLLRHLVDAYFSFNADANRLLHRSTFMANLSLPPMHQRFPSTALLHAICAMGSFYTAAVEPAPRPTSSPFPVDDPYESRHWMFTGRPSSFAEAHAKHAHVAIWSAAAIGHEVVQCIQAEVILSGWYWASAKWAEAYMAIGRCIRSCVPMGINVAAPFTSISGNRMPLSLLPRADNALEEELRRNMFWMVYALERMMGAGHGWPLLLDDNDVFQLLPACGEDFEAGRSVAVEERQWSHDYNVLTQHPARHTDPFVLYIKSCIILSRVKVFNMRFRAKYYAGDPASVLDDQGVPTEDIRRTPAFREVHQLVLNFEHSIPLQFRHPIQDGVVNSHLFSVLLMPQMAIILLHETHANVDSGVCQSATRILTAARNILNLMYDVCATSYSLSLLGQFAILGWYSAGRVLARFLRSARKANAAQQVATLLAELSVIRTAMAEAGRRLPIASRYEKMMQDLINECSNSPPSRAVTSLPSSASPSSSGTPVTVSPPANRPLPRSVLSSSAGFMSGIATMF